MNQKFVEFCGDGLDQLALPDRATIANMAPEYGATVSFFPIDDESLRYLRLTGRSAAQIKLVEAYSKAQGLFRTKETLTPRFTDMLELDLASVVPSIAGPARPQDRIELTKSKGNFRKSLLGMVGKDMEQVTTDAYILGGTNPENLANKSTIAGTRLSLTHGDVVIAAITSCANTSNPAALMAAGLLAKKGRRKGTKEQAVGKGHLSPRIAGCDRLSCQGGAITLPRAVGVLRGWLWLHDLRGKLRATERRNRGCDQRCCADAYLMATQAG